MQEVMRHSTIRVTLPTPKLSRLKSVLHKPPWSRFFYGRRGARPTSEEALSTSRPGWWSEAHEGAVFGV
jgi:hypothetical protein